ncbi:hypothetical protein [Amycolatopsis sp. cmx-11-12]|uniref:hypothetical protein n=1 Tax=Amycolatopsis sp. cmx-11-12 TaxID=2785795 RepID=UPI0039184E0C
MTCSTERAKNEAGEAKSLAQQAKLSFRKVVASQPVAQQPGQLPASRPGRPPVSGASSSNATPPPVSGGAASAKPGGGGTVGAPVRQQSSAPAPSPSSQAPAPQWPDGSVDAQAAREIQEAKAIRQNPALAPANPSDPAAQAARKAAVEKAFASLNCTPNAKDPLVGNDDPKLPLVACGDKDTNKYLLEPEFLPGTEISNASSGTASGAMSSNAVSTDTSRSTTWPLSTSESVAPCDAALLKPLEPGKDRDPG